MSADGPLFEKFHVTRVDGKDAPGQKHHGCQYFVLDLTHDPHARTAARAYARSCWKTHPRLSEELRARVDELFVGARAAIDPEALP